MSFKHKNGLMNVVSENIRIKMLISFLSQLDLRKLVFVQLTLNFACLLFRSNTQLSTALLMPDHVEMFEYYLIELKGSRVLV